MLRESALAPDFTLEADDGRKVSLSDYHEKKVVLYFYPKDNTAGCTAEALAFRDEYPRITAAGAVVLGVSPDGVESHRKFKAKHNLPFTLLSDHNHQVAEMYSAWGEKKMYGRTRMGIIRSTFIIDEVGRIIKIFPKVAVKGHIEEVLAVLNA